MLNNIHKNCHLVNKQLNYIIHHSCTLVMYKKFVNANIIIHKKYDIKWYTIWIILKYSVVSGHYI